jgi:hypothetical protein
LNNFYTRSDDFFERIKTSWESKTTQRVVSWILVLAFALGILIYFLVHYGYLPKNFENGDFNYPFAAIEIPFTLLLLIELMSLIFVLPTSVAKSVMKQFELLSLIFLRFAFKEFSHIHSLGEWKTNEEPFIHMVAYGVGALAIFVLIGFTYRLQRHIRITAKEEDQTRFVQSKKFLALLLLTTFILIGLSDLYQWIFIGKYPHSFTFFYTILIFSDILIVLIALRYTLDYYRIFRYSAFVLATILIRVALSLEPYFNVILGVISAVFVYFLTMSYNYFVEDFKQES